MSRFQEFRVRRKLGKPPEADRRLTMANNIQSWETAVCQEIYRGDFSQERLRGLLATPEVQESIGRKRWKLTSYALQNETFRAMSAPIHFAAMRGKEEVIRILVEEGGDCNSFVEYTTDEYDEEGYGYYGGDDYGEKYYKTPLHIAVRVQSVKVVETLLELGSDEELMGQIVDGRSGKRYFGTPLEFAKLTGNQAMISILEEKAGRALQRGKSLLAIATNRIKEKPDKSAELEKALENHRKINQIQAEWKKENADIDARIVLKEKELESLKAQRQVLKTSKDSQVTKLEKSVDHRNARQIASLTREIEELNTFLKTVKDAISGDTPNAYASDEKVNADASGDAGWDSQLKY